MKIERAIIAITGAGGGLGTAMATRFAKKGARLALIDIQSGSLEKLKTEQVLPEEDCRTYTCDVSSEEQVDQVWEACDAGEIDDFGACLLWSLIWIGIQAR